MSDQKSRCEVLKEVVDQIEVLYDDGKLEWIACDLDNLPTTTCMYLNSMVTDSGIEYKMANPLDEFQGSYIFKMENALLGFLHHDPISSVHMWIDNKFKYGLQNMAAFNYILARRIANGAFPATSALVLPRKSKPSNRPIQFVYTFDPLLTYSKKIKRHKLWELRSFDQPQRLIAKGDIWHISALVKKNEDIIFGSTHFIIPAGGKIDQFLNKS